MLMQLIENIIAYYKSINLNVKIINKNSKFWIMNIVTGLPITMLSLQELTGFFETQSIIADLLK